MMQAEVNKIVYNALIEGRDVWLPGIGSLVLERRSAWRSSPKRLERPVRRVAFLSERKGVSLVELIAEIGACDTLTAESIYTRWLDKSRTGNGVSIVGVGELNHKWFSLDPNMDAVLNPLGHEAVTLKPRPVKTPVALFFALLLLAVVGYGVWWVKDSMGLGSESAPDEERTAFAEKNDAAGASGIGCGVDGPEVRSVVEAGVESGRATDTVGIGPAEPTQPVQSDMAVPERRAMRQEATPAPLAVERMTSGRTYAVWGVYSTEANARRAVDELQESHPGVTPRIYYYGTKWMVSVQESDSSEEIRAYINRAGSDMKGVWPYSKR